MGQSPQLKVKSRHETDVTRSNPLSSKSIQNMELTCHMRHLQIPKGKSRYSMGRTVTPKQWATSHHS
ncbi:unnamed protein product [Prunus armeniaca]|uniref:Uncharacterized protein n=1 Tax=Prunus armeniaca TaxID=36596 RepID=A0A6J5W243_PRUAR|nr:unnamed protein product [Prunus armeniaca]